MSSNPWLRCNKLSKNHGYSSEIVSVEREQFIPLAEGGTKQIVYQGRSVAVEIPLNRGHICYVLSKSILSGLRAKENHANYAFGRLVSSRVVSIVLLRRRDRKNIRCWCSISSDDWLSPMTNQNMCYIIFPNNSFQMARSFRSSFFQRFTPFCFWVHDCHYCREFFFSL